MALCLWLRYEWDFKHYVYELEAQQVLWTGPYILIAASSLTMATSILGSWATVIEDFQLISLVRFLNPSFSNRIFHFKIHCFKKKKRGNGFCSCAIFARFLMAEI